MTTQMILVEINMFDNYHLSNEVKDIFIALVVLIALLVMIRADMSFARQPLPHLSRICSLCFKKKILEFNILVYADYEFLTLPYCCSSSDCCSWIGSCSSVAILSARVDGPNTSAVAVYVVANCSPSRL